MSATKEILIKAKSLLEKHGWIKHTWARDSYGADMRLCQLADYVARGDCSGLCLGGAIMAAGRLQRSDDGVDTSWDMLKRAVGGESISEWNDSPVRTREEIMGVLDKAIVACE